MNKKKIDTHALLTGGDVLVIIPIAVKYGIECATALGVALNMINPDDLTFDMYQLYENLEFLDAETMIKAIQALINNGFFIVVNEKQYQIDTDKVQEIMGE